MRQHLTQEELIKYLDTTDPTEEYLLWLDEAQEHVDDCALCQEQIRRYLTVERVCEADGLAQGIAWMDRESEVRRNIVLLRLGMMEQNARIQKIRQLILQGQFQELVIGQSQIGRSKQVFRGNGSDLSGQQFCAEQTETGLRIRFDDPVMNGHEIICESENARNMQLGRIVWNQDNHEAIADFEGIADVGDYHIYIL